MILFLIYFSQISSVGCKKKKNLRSGKGYFFNSLFQTDEDAETLRNQRIHTLACRHTRSCRQTYRNHCKHFHINAYKISKTILSYIDTTTIIMYHKHTPLTTQTPNHETLLCIRIFCALMDMLMIKYLTTKIENI